MYIYNFYGKCLFLLMVTETQVHYGREAWQQAAGMAAGAGNEDLHLSPQAQSGESALDTG